MGKKALPWLTKAKEITGLLTTTEVSTAYHIEEALKHNVDILWIGARTTVSPFAIQEIANCLKGVNIPVMVKNPINPDISLWIGAIERLYNSGLKKLTAIHRGFSSYEKDKYRNSPIWEIPLELKRKIPTLPIICDPSHIGGHSNLIQEISEQALQLKMDGLMIETHTDPKNALSDSRQQITPQVLEKIISELSALKKSKQKKEEIIIENISILRREIDDLDHQLLKTSSS